MSYESVNYRKERVVTELTAATIADLRAERDRIDEQLRAWDYPPHGSMTASCGHRVFDDCGEGVAYHDWDTFSDGSYGPCIAYATYCPWCAIKLKVSGYYVPDHDGRQ